MEFWIDLLRTYIVEGHCVTAKGIPSINEQTEMRKQEERRLEARIKELGPGGLKKKEEELLEAMTTNEVLLYC